MGSARGRGSGRERGSDLRYNMEITLDEAFKRQDGANSHPHLGNLRGLLRQRREGGHQAKTVR